MQAPFDASDRATALAYAARAAGDEGDPARELVGWRGEGELVELQRPVLDRVGFLFRQRDVAA